MKLISKIKFGRLFAFAAVVFLSVACSSDLFDQDAGERITPEQHYNSEIDVNVMMNGTLVPLQNVMPNMILVDGLRSDQMLVTENANADLRAINEWSLSTGNPYLNPSEFYKLIINVNEILEYLDLVTERDRNFDAVVNHTYRGTLIAIRSWTYLQLVRLYGEVTWIEDNMTSLPDAGTQVRMTKTVLLDTLINQITPYIYDEADGYVELPLFGFINSKAILGEIYLEKDDYENAVFFLKASLESYTEVPGVGNALYKVDNTYQKDAWTEIFTGGEDAPQENLVSVPFNSFQRQTNPLAQWTLPNDLFLVKPSQVLVDSFQMQVRNSGTIPGDLYRGVGVTYDTLSSASDTYIKKYALDDIEPYSADIIISRAAEIHLLLAEALNRMGDSEKALIFLNSGIAGTSPKPSGYTRFNSNRGIRGRVLLEPKAVADSIVGLERIEIIEDFILAEKALECAFEGKRMTDLMRIAKRRNDPAYLANIVASKYTDQGMADNIREFLMTEANWYLPSN